MHAFCYNSENFVTCVMPMLIVHFLETIQVNE